MLKTLKNAWKIPELKKKLLFTLFIVVLYRIGANIPVPYVDPSIFQQASTFFSGTILEFLNILSGEALGKATLLALGVSPYITASIVIQLLTIVFPKSLGKWSKDGEEGKKKITALTRIVTVALAVITAIGYAFYLESAGLLIPEEVKFFHYLVVVLCYCAGAALVMWMAEKINESGIGNGISMILFANILAGGASLMANLWNNVFPLGDFSSFNWVGLVFSLCIVLLFLGMILLVVWMSDAERRIPIQYAKRVVGRKMYGGQNANLPIKVNMSGVMPIIFANSIVALPATIISFADSDMSSKISQWIGKWFNYDSWLYFGIFLALLIGFAYFYVMISFDPVEVANNIKNNGGAIPGIRVGKPTVLFIKKVLYRITLIGALLVAFIACFPMVITNIESMIGKSQYFVSTMAFGGSSLMIVVGVALETARELEAQMSLRNYKGFLD